MDINKVKKTGYLNSIFDEQYSRLYIIQNIVNEPLKDKRVSLNITKILELIEDYK